MSFTWGETLEVMLSPGPSFFGPCAPIDLPSSISIARRSHLLSRTRQVLGDTGSCRGGRGVVGSWDGAGRYVWVGVSLRPRPVTHVYPCNGRTTMGGGGGSGRWWSGMLGFFKKGSAPLVGVR